MTRPRRLLPPPRPRHVFSALLLAAALALTTACGNQQASGTSATEASTPVTVTDLDDKTRTIPAGKPAALFFFSVGCGECLGGAKSLSKAAEAMGSSADHLLWTWTPRNPRRPSTGSAATSGPRAPGRHRYRGRTDHTVPGTSLSTLVMVDANGNVTFRATVRSWP